MPASPPAAVQNGVEEQSCQKAACELDPCRQAGDGPVQADHKSKPNEADLRYEADTAPEGLAGGLEAEAVGKGEQA